MKYLFLFVVFVLMVVGCKASESEILFFRLDGKKIETPLRSPLVQVSSFGIFVEGEKILAFERPFVPKKSDYSENIDGVLTLSPLANAFKRVKHAIISGKYLDKRFNTDMESGNVRAKIPQPFKGLKEGDSFSASFLIHAPENMPVSLFKTIYESACVEGFTGVYIATPKKGSGKSFFLYALNLSKEKSNSSPGTFKSSKKSKKDIYNKVKKKSVGSKTLHFGKSIDPRFSFGHNRLWRSGRVYRAKNDKRREIVVDVTDELITMKLMRILKRYVPRTVKEELFSLKNPQWKSWGRKIQSDWLNPLFPKGILYQNIRDRTVKNLVSLELSSSLTYGVFIKVVNLLRNLPGENNRPCRLTSMLEGGDLASPLGNKECMLPFISLKLHPKKPQKIEYGAMDKLGFSNYLWDAWPLKYNMPYSHLSWVEHKSPITQSKRNTREHWNFTKLISVVAKPPLVKGNVSVEYLRIATYSRRGDIYNCYRNELMRYPSLSGIVGVKVTLGEKRKITSCQVTKPISPMKNMGRCICCSMKKWRFVIPDKDSATIFLSWELSPKEGEK
jgi:hypothetical protein